MDFKLTLGSIVYEGKVSTSGTEGGKEYKSWLVTGEFNKFRFSISIPKEKNAAEEEVLVFITAFHKTFEKVRKEQRDNNDLKFLNN